MADRQTHMEEGSTPVPDPTSLTTAALTREIAALKELLTTRLDAMDKAIELFAASINKVPSDTDKQVLQLKELIWERFHALDVQFDCMRLQLQERAARREEQNKSLATAIDKAEGAITKQIDQQRQTIDAKSTQSDIKINAVNDRVTRIESEGSGQKGAQREQRSETTSNVNVLGLVLAAVFGLLGLVGVFWGISQAA